MEEEANQEEANKEWKAKQEEIKSKDEQKRKSNAARRAKQKARKKDGKGGQKMDVDGDGEVKVNLGGAAARLQKTGREEEGNDVHKGAPVADEGGIVIHDDD